MKFPRLPKAALKVPPGFKKPRVEDFKSDMQRLGEDIAEEFKETIIENIKTNKYKFKLKQSTIDRKGSSTPLIDSGELLDAIYREETMVSVEDTPREDSGLTNKELAMVHEYGTKDKHIPARPIWRKTYRDFKGSARNRIKNFLDSGEF